MNALGIISGSFSMSVFKKHLPIQSPKTAVIPTSKALLIFHDQLNLSVFPTSLLNEKPTLVFLESEVKGKSLPYHKKKLIYVLSAQRHFALECQKAGFPIVFIASKQHYDEQLIDLFSNHKQIHFSAMESAEWDTRQRLKKALIHSPNHELLSNTFFLAKKSEFIPKIDKRYRMEFFYREMRRKTGLLMNDDKPEGNTWNFDSENRKKIPKRIPIPPILTFKTDSVTEEVIELVDATFPHHFGQSDAFALAVTRDQALEALHDFIQHRLPFFGDYEDAMSLDEPYLFHSTLSIYLNNGLLLPMEVCQAAETAFRRGKAPLNAVEGFIRQIIGWREFVKIYYEAMMPDVRSTNFFEHKNGLPAAYWHGETELTCLQQNVHSVIQHGYAHHIPRLMVLSNFALLTNSDPAELLYWFWMGFVDAYEWVVLPNVLGMSSFADGGILASKPYVSAANYINKMSNYCRTCRFDPKKRTGEDACPFNALYWNFVDKQRDLFNQNGRVSFMVSSFDKRPEDEKNAIRAKASSFIKNLPRWPSHFHELQNSLLD